MQIKKCWYGLADAIPTQKTDPIGYYFASLFIKDDIWETCTFERTVAKLIPCINKHYKKQLKGSQ